MKKHPTICLIGDVVVDVTLKNGSSDTKLRFGGITHAARTFWAFDISFDIGYFAPAYLDEQIKDYVSHLGGLNVIKLGNVTGAPYVFLIQEPKEVGPQGYEFVLRDELKVEYHSQQIEYIRAASYSHYLVISGNFDLVELINYLEGNVYVDVSNNIKDIAIFRSLKRKISSLFISTSSDIFRKHFEGDFIAFARLFEGYSEEVILKENRGGSRCYNFRLGETFHASSQPRKITHSVGVGDVFDATYVRGFLLKDNHLQKMVLSSWVASEYAVTTFPDDFKKGVNRVLKSDINELVHMSGVSLPWEDRKHINIYIAGPDFDFIDVTPIDTLETALNYHNFTPRRPIKENGQMEENAPKERKQELVAKDMIILDECSILIAVLLYNDPGTLVEIGYAVAKGIPSFVYDPHNLAKNCMLTELPDLITDDLDEIITEVFIKGANLKTHDK